MFEKHTIAFGLILLTQNALDVGKILLLMISIEASRSQHSASFGTASFKFISVQQIKGYLLYVQ